MATIQPECLICKDYREPQTNRWYSPTTEQRRTNYLHDVKFSHGFCPPCHVLSMRKDGCTEAEIERIVKAVESTE